METVMESIHESSTSSFALTRIYLYATKRMIAIAVLVKNRRSRFEFSGVPRLGNHKI